MSKIVKLSSVDVTIQLDSGKECVFSKKCIIYEGAVVGDHVAVYRDTNGKTVIDLQEIFDATQKKKSHNRKDNFDTKGPILGFIAIVLGLLGIASPVFAFVGIVLAIVTLAKGHKSGFAVAGIIFGIIGGMLGLTIYSDQDTDPKQNEVAEKQVLTESADTRDNRNEVISKREDSDSKTVDREIESSTTKGESDYEVTDTDFHYYVNDYGTEYHAYVEITNTGDTNLYLDSATFDIEDDNGHLLASDDFISSCPDIIAPGEKGYFYNGLGSMSIDKSVSLNNGVNFNPTCKVERAEGNIVEYVVSDTSFSSDDYGYPRITGRITNDTDEDDSYCYINVIYYDNNNRVLAIDGTSVTDIEAGSTKSFEMSSISISDKVTVNDIAKYKVIARRSYYQY